MVWLVVHVKAFIKDCLFEKNYLVAFQTVVLLLFVK